MTPYEWKETEEQYLAIVKPKFLFVEGSIHESHRRKYETEWSGTSKSTGESSLYAFGYIKKWCSKEQAEKITSWINDGLTWHPEEEVSRKIA